MKPSNSDGNISRVRYLSDFQSKKKKQLVEKDGRSSQVEAEVRGCLLAAVAATSQFMSKYSRLKSQP
jgi:hypothetical protein